MTNLGHTELSRVFWLVLFAASQTAASACLAHYLWKAISARTHAVVAACWGIAWIGLVAGASILPRADSSLLFSLPATMTVVCAYGMRIWWRKDRLAGAIVWGCAALFSGTACVMLSLIFLESRPWVVPPSKAEIIALAQQVGPEQLRADAAELLRGHRGIDVLIGRWPPKQDVPEKGWPKSFDVMKPVLVRGIGRNSQDTPVLGFFLLKEFDLEICIEVIPAGDNQQLKIGAFDQSTPYPSWREKIAEGVYLYSTLKPH